LLADSRRIHCCIQHLCPNRACGPDNLSAEHLQYAPPSLTIYLKLMFNAIFTDSFVPDKFGLGFIIPLLKGKTGNVTDIRNYRPITLTPIVSKLLKLDPPAMSRLFFN
jgi:hypothetical protein